jgi:hypothetical protein
VPPPAAIAPVDVGTARRASSLPRQHLLRNTHSLHCHPTIGGNAPASIAPSTSDTDTSLREHVVGANPRPRGTARSGEINLIHRALVAVNGLYHQFEHRVEQLTRLLGVAIGQQLHQALQVGEEHGHRPKGK